MTSQVTKRHLPKGILRALRSLKQEVQTWRLHRTGVRAARRKMWNGSLKLNIGCGPNVKTGWTNIDLSGHADLHLDLREPLPFGDSSASIVYSEHFLEHLEYPHDVLP